MNNYSTLLSNNSITNFGSYTDIMSTPTDLSTKSLESPIDKIDIKKEDVSSNSPSMGSLESSKVSMTNSINIPTSLTSTSRINKSHLKSSGNKKSFVWKYFNHPKNADGIEDRTRTECIECRSQLAFNASGTTTTMLNHLKSRHPKIAEKEEWRKVKLSVNTNTCNSSKINDTQKNDNSTINSDLSTTSCTTTNNSISLNHDSPPESFLTLDMSKNRVNPSPENNTNDLNIWPMLTGKTDKLLDQGRFLYFANVTPKQYIVSTRGSTVQSHTEPIYQNADQSLNMKTPNQNFNTTPSDINNNNSTPLYTLGSDNKSNYNDVATSRSPGCKRKRKNVTVNKLTLNGATLHIQKKLKVEAVKPSECTDLASIQSINAMSQNSCNSINHMLGKSFLNPDNQHALNNSSNSYVEYNHHATGFHQTNSDTGSNLYSTFAPTNHNDSTLSPNNNNNSVLNIINHIPNKDNNSTSSAGSTNNAHNFTTNSNQDISKNSICINSKISNTSENILAYWLIRDLRPYSILEEGGIKTLFSLLMPSIAIPSINRLKSFVIPSIYSTLKSDILSDFSSESGCAFSIELWNSTVSSSTYASVKLHYYSKMDQKLNCKMLKTNEINAKLLCSDLLVNCCNELGLDVGELSFLPLVTNEADSLRDELDYVVSMEHHRQCAVVVPCLVSSLRSVARLGCQQELVGRLVEQCRGLKEVSKAYNLELGESDDQHMATNGAPINQQQCMPDPQQYSYSPTSNSTNISSKFIGCETFQLIQWVHANLDFIDEKLDGFNTHRFSKEDETFLRQLVPLLEHIYQTLAVIEQNKLFFSASMIKSIILTMTKSPFQPKPTDHPGVTQFKLAIRNRLDAIYPSTGPLHEILWIATLLDPRFKKHHDFTSEELILIDKIKNQIQPNSPIKSKQNNSISNDSGMGGSPSNEPNLTPITNTLLSSSPTTEIIGNGNTSTGSASIPTSTSNTAKSSTASIKREELQFIFGDDFVSPPASEMDQYLIEHKIDIEKDPVKWWLDNEHRFPKLSKLAMKYLCIPLSNQNHVNSTINNSSFCQDSYLISNRRKELDPDDIDSFLFLNHNWR